MGFGGVLAKAVAEVEKERTVFLCDSEKAAKQLLGDIADGWVVCACVCMYVLRKRAL